MVILLIDNKLEEKLGTSRTEESDIIEHLIEFVPKMDDNDYLLTYSYLDMWNTMRKGAKSLSYGH